MYAPVGRHVYYDERERKIDKVFLFMPSRRRIYSFLAAYYNNIKGVFLWFHYYTHCRGQ